MKTSRYLINSNGSIPLHKSTNTPPSSNNKNNSQPAAAAAAAANNRPAIKPVNSLKHSFQQVSINQIQIMGLSINNTQVSQNHNNIYKIFLVCNYILLGAGTSCIFLTLSLRLFPSICGFFLILLHAFTICVAVAGCSSAVTASNKWYAIHMVSTVLTLIFQGSVSVMIFTRPVDFLGDLKSYVRQEDGVAILKLGGGLCVLIFCLEWVVLVYAFLLSYYAFVEGDGSGNMVRSAKVQDDDLKDWPWPFQV